MLLRLIRTDNAKATILIRLLVGVVFLTEGIQKFIFPNLLGFGRFSKIGFADPEFFAILTADFEIMCGTLILVGLLTRFAAIPLIVIMLVAFVTTKIPILINEGFWPMLHECRTDWAMLLGCIFLLMKGGGGWSLDRYMTQ